MRKFRSIIFLILFSMFLVGCQTTDQTNDVTGTVDITISENQQEETIAEAEIELSDETNLLELLKDHFDVVVQKDGFITSIEGKEQVPEDDIYWMYTINGKSANVGAAEYEVSDGDEINFDLQKVSY
ncbi:DUF4430 domain-containing protein [Paraliobacillus salinarum]|uniref:DUF4430 domain-containing protein n=1 Tax=Paraliobacillus salinarum TaxID=1158996 RepID=UPI0015F5614D|nr:DUF4430 domain-containing protein [Paraliobacillus salinarum]